MLSALISRAASALRCARLRTSAATTAKPRPCSPARAASTAAFSARMLVWKAIASITPLISSILRADCDRPPMARTTSPTTSPPLRATSAAPAASWLASRAWPAFCATVAVSSSMELAVCCSVLACVSVRCDRSWWPARSCAAVAATAPAPPITWRTMRRRLTVMSSSASIRRAISSWPPVRTLTVRSPSATLRAMRTATYMGRSTCISSTTTNGTLKRVSARNTPSRRRRACATRSSRPATATASPAWRSRAARVAATCASPVPRTACRLPSRAFGSSRAASAAPKAACAAADRPARSGCVPVPGVSGGCASCRCRSRSRASPSR